MSFPSVLDLEAVPKLRHWLSSLEWQEDFERKDLDRSRSYINNGSIQSIVFPKSSFDPVFKATVQGTSRRPYRVTVDVLPDLSTPSGFNASADCTCPVGVQCKHAAAVLGRLAVIAASDPGKPSRHAPGPAALSGILSSEARKWLDSLKPVAASAAKASTSFLAYCIEPIPSGPEKGRLHLVLRPGSILKSGLIRIKDSIAAADPVKPAAYMSVEDIPLAARYRGLYRNLYQEAPLRGPAWPEILDAALKLGRLFFSPVAPSYKSEADHTRLAKGPPAAAEASWQIYDDGRTKPQVRLPDERLILLPTEPPLYIDPASHLLGPVKSKLGPGLLARWADGPVLRPDEIPAFNEVLSALPDAAALPRPADFPTETLPAAKPAPRLHIRSERVGDHRHFDSLIGLITFHYPGAPPLPPLSAKSPETSTWVEGGKRLLLTRDRSSEKAFIKDLERRDLAPLARFIPPVILEPGFRQALCPARPFPSASAAWIRFLADHADELRARGWTIDIDSNTGLVIHDLTDFFPAIERETDHGIDWFKFDLSGEIDGRRINLIPFIADAIDQGFTEFEDEQIPETFLFRAESAKDGYIRFPGRRFIEICRNVAHLFHGNSSPSDGRIRIDRLAAAGIADRLGIDGSDTARALAALGRNLRDLTGLPATKPPAGFNADLRHYQLEGFRWLRFLADNQLHGILADDMGLGKTVQTLAHLATARSKRGAKKPSLVIAPTSVITNWAAEAARFTPKLKTLLLHGADRAASFAEIPKSDLVLTSYPLLVRDLKILSKQQWHILVLDEAQYIKNPRTAAATAACSLKAAHRLCLSGTPLENHLGELWSLMRFLMPGFLGDEKSFGKDFRRPIERDRDSDARLALSRRISPLILRRTKDQVATELPPKTEIIHHVTLSQKESDLYESIRSLMDKRVREAIAARGLAKSHIIVLDALLKLRQVCCHPTLVKSAAKPPKEASKLGFLTTELLPTLIEENRRILLFSSFTSMLSLIEAYLAKAGIPYLKLTGQTKDRATLVEKFQSGEVPVFLISLKAGGTGLNLTAADTVVHYDPWWNPAAENQATDRAHRIGQNKPVFVHKLICQGTIEDRILELQKHKSALVEALLSEETTKLRLDPETLSHLLAPL